LKNLSSAFTGLSVFGYSDSTDKKDLLAYDNIPYIALGRVE
jgi:hypothetical protein